MKKAVVINLNDLGDVVFSIPVVKNLIKMRYSVDFVVDESYKWAITPFLKINKLILLKRKFIRESFLNNVEWKSEINNFLMSLKEIYYDVSINLHSSFLSAQIHSHINSNLKVGFTFENNRYIYLNTDSYYLNTLGNINNKISNFFHATTLFNSFLLPLEKPVIDYDVLYDNIKNNFEKNSVILHIGSGSDIKKWTVDNWIILIKFLIKNNYKVYIVGTEKDLKDSQYISKFFKNKKNFFNLVLKMPMHKYLDFVKTKEYLVAVDTGVLHMAAALGKKVIGIYGSTSIFETGAFSSTSVNISLNLSCSPCFKKYCGNKKCMKKLKGNIIYLLIKYFKNKTIYKKIERKYNVKIFIPENFVNKKNTLFLRRRSIINYFKKYSDNVKYENILKNAVKSNDKISTLINVSNQILKSAIMPEEINNKRSYL